MLPPHIGRLQYGDVAVAGVVPVLDPYRQRSIEPRVRAITRRRLDDEPFPDPARLVALPALSATLGSGGGVVATVRWQSGQ